jgi:hypothetical protein
MRNTLVRVGLVGVLIAAAVGLGTTPAFADDPDTASISGTVYGGPGTSTTAPNIDVLLVGDVNTGFFGTGPKIIASQMVSSNGTFDFTGLAASDSNGYQICYSAPQLSLYGSQCYNNEAWNGFVQPDGPGFVTLPGDPIALSAGQALTGIDAHLPVQAIVTGTVTDALTHKGLGNVQVQLVEGAGSGPAPTVTTDSNGVWIATIPSGSVDNQACFNAAGATGGNSLGYLNQCYNDVAWPDGQPAPAGTDFGAFAGDLRTNIDAALTPRLGTITGRVAAGDTGAVLPGVTVSAFTISKTTSDANLDKLVTTTTTGGDGTYSLTLPSGKSYDICFSTTLKDESKYKAQCYGYQAWSNKPANSAHEVGVPLAATAVSVSAGVTTPNINGLLNPGVITGQVTDKATKAAIPGVTVVLMGKTTGQYLLVTTTNASGDYTFGGLPASKTAYYVCFNSTGLDGTSALTQYNGQCYKNQSWIGYGPRASKSVAVPATSGVTTTGINAALTASATVSG